MSSATPLQQQRDDNDHSASPQPNKLTSDTRHPLSPQRLRHHREDKSISSSPVVESKRGRTHSPKSPRTRQRRQRMQQSLSASCPSLHHSQRPKLSSFAALVQRSEKKLAILDNESTTTNIPSRRRRLQRRSRSARTLRTGPRRGGRRHKKQQEALVLRPILRNSQRNLLKGLDLAAPHSPPPGSKGVQWRRDSNLVEEHAVDKIMGECWDACYFTEEEIAEFRYQAFCEKMGLDDEVYQQ